MKKSPVHSSNPLPVNVDFRSKDLNPISAMDLKAIDHNISEALLAPKQYLPIHWNESHARHHILNISEENTTDHDPPRTNISTQMVRYFETIVLFQPAEELEFPTKEGTSPRIPHIIHQVYTNETLPAAYCKNYISTFIKNNPKWQYRFWTYESGRKFLVRYYPYMLKLFDRVDENSVIKTDIIKYAVIYEFGGVYSDLDMKNLRPLDRATMKYACIIPTEPFEHPNIMIRKPYLLGTSILLCRPKHPFFKRLLRALQSADPEGRPVKISGSQFMTMQYNEFMYQSITADSNKIKQERSSNSPYFYRLEITGDAEDNDAIYVPNSQYFMDNVDPTMLDKDGKIPLCRHIQGLYASTELLLLPEISKRACDEFDSRKEVRKNKKYTFTVHYWHHLWVMDLAWLLTQKTMHIREAVPNCILYE